MFVVGLVTSHLHFIANWLREPTEIAFVPSWVSMGTIDESCLLGFYAIEYAAAGKPFRWTEAASKFGILVAKLRYCVRFYLLSSRPAELIANPFVLVKGCQVEVQIRSVPHLMIEFVANASNGWLELFLSCNPFQPSRHGEADHRVLGLPISGIELTPVSDN